jgi:aminoglycoside phosphotransferase (APT) family kinase protein
LPPRRGSSPTTDVPPGGGRFALTRPHGSPSLVRKEGDRTAIAREAFGARRAGPGIAARVVHHGDGVLISEWIDGAPRRLAQLGHDDAVALGVLLRRVHDRASSTSGGLPWWPSRARSLCAYARGRARDCTARACGDAERDLVIRAASRVTAATGSASTAFAFLHGDLVEDNIVWGQGGPVLVDWEFWRMGDPAEDIAYLEALNEVTADVSAGIRAGYRAGSGVRLRSDAWRALVLVDAAMWHRDHGDRATARALLARAEAT